MATVDPALESASTPAAFLTGGGELGELCRRHDWAASPLGEPDSWPQSLKTAVGVMLRSRQPVWIGWGRELYFFYNDAYQSIIGGKHPWALGRPTSEVWSEIWNQVGPMLGQAMVGVEGIYVEEQLLIMHRNGYPEETYYTFSYTPIPDDDGRPGGIFCANTDDTTRVISDRQLSTLREIGERLADVRHWRDACERAAAALATNTRDVPFALLYMLGDDGRTLSLAASTGIARGHPAAPDIVSIDAQFPWPFAATLPVNDAHLVDDLRTRFPVPSPTGAWSESPTRAALLHIAPAGQGGRRGVLVVGLNPFRLFDAPYRDFLSLVAGQIGGAIANADAYEYERQRAEALAELDRTKTAFFSNLSHEFRTPLTLMLGPLEESLTNADTLPASELERVKIVHRNSLRLLKLVNSLLDFARTEAGRAQASFQSTDLSRYTAELASNFRSATQKAGLELAIDCPPLSQPVYVDRDMWEKIVLNLLSNAFKFTFDGEIRVSMREHDGRAELIVRDTGTGIPESELPRLFERFHRIKNARGRSFEGSGIGLALVKELVEQHGGALRAESVVDQGTAFFVDLPFGSAHLPKDQIGANDSGAGAVRAQAFVEEALRWLPETSVARHSVDEGSSVAMLGERAPAQERTRILVADDNADMRDYIARLLGGQHDIDTVGDGDAALAAIRARRPDLLLTDIMMPKLDGFGLIKALRDDTALRDLPIIVLSARAGEEARVEGLSAGADDYLVKPFSAREMIARIDGALAMARVRRSMGDALREEAKSLERKVTERTAELLSANEQLRQQAEEREAVEHALRQSQKMEAVGKLTGGIAHDFNNLLQVVGGNLQLLVKDVAGSEKAEQRVRNALAGVSRGAKLAAQLLAFGRRQPLAPKVVNLGRFVRGIDDLLRRALGDGVEVETVISGGLWNSLVDPSQVENALLNLAINARDAMNGHGRLTIEAGNAALTDDYATRHADVSPGQYVMLAVTDTGCGMTHDVMEHVFEPFFTTKPEGQGTGLGLSMVYGFVKQSNGHINIYSEPGQGTTVRIYLPRVLQAEDVTVDVDSGAIVGGSELVLVVEDDADVRETVVELLSDLGYAVLKAKDAKDALAIIESGAPIDLLFTDVVMPGPVRSPELARQARERLPNVAILFTSGYTDNAIVHGGRLDPGIELLSKPYRREALARKVRHVLRNQARRGQSTPTDLAPADAARRLRILFVEDDDMVRAATAEMLGEMGYSVLQAADGAAALRLLDAGNIDLLVCDDNLPDMRGADVAQKIRERFPTIPVVFATGASHLPTATNGVSIDGAALLRKPFNLAALDQALTAAASAA